MACLVPIFLSLVLAQRAAAQVFGPPFNNTNGSSGSSTGAGLVVGVTFAGGCRTLLSTVTFTTNIWLSTRRLHRYRIHTYRGVHF